MEASSINWISKLPNGYVKDVLLSHWDQEFAQSAAKRYLEADDDLKDDIEAFFYNNGPKIMNDAAAKAKYGIPTAEDLQSWFSL